MHLAGIDADALLVETVRQLIILRDERNQRVQFLNAYQDLLLTEPESAVSQPLKEVFLAMRVAAESHE